jgi:hypothetical protein
VKYETADDWLSEAAAARHPPPASDGLPWRYHSQLVAACKKRGIWFSVQDDGRIHLSEFGSRIYLETFDTAEQAILFVDGRPLKEGRC